MSVITYRGYTARLTVEPESGVISGRVLDLRDVLYFEAETPREAVQAFHDTVDDYLAWCAEDGREPEKPYSGRLPFRTKPETHRKIALAAAKAGKSINAWMEQTLADRATAAMEEDQHTSA